MQSFSALNPKVYCFNTAEHMENRKAKGVNTVVLFEKGNKQI